ncbi:SDR family NAD(P)-dependent oxidoreductase [Francisella tularensis]|uniref:SDR family NAD(P)-dependent oxidoreductase n=1 Tax=Francisella tularensis TaxID=263 RepID=UPI000173E433|nr:SDR family NAD(P)-dependent oxidoreductase [Francisella tularensis]ACD30464.1 short-chain dehydrogenase/reductase SDR [Francisella tularensis subsp. mediasiatica FSC147]MBK2077561.1 SDR family NAD(P)-dependent oxidoreductase [Francisella tularensis subsp. mediasiatica]MBK2102207.1 SDR family NAD(P)-dependent oxidoreductase [Francisella tularensis subsp. mediasiatica]MBK2104755.1 SDR family NAD(P)-dependent oxidoreductase [Francisella tularensis subsp. mediasiatica]MDN9002814.1 SDR family NA
MSGNLVVIGGSGAIGNAVIKRLRQLYPNANIYAFSRAKVVDCVEGVVYEHIDYTDESTIEKAAKYVYDKSGSINLIFVATGILHTQDIKPEKSLKELSADKFIELFKANTIFPALVAKHFIPKLAKDTKSIFAAISARVGSISDNQLGGWYAYRASKAALNMFIKTASIETKRLNPNAVIVRLHPGTVDSHLSEPFQARVPEGKLFTPEYSASKLIEVLDGLKADDSGKCFAWDGNEIIP